MTPRIGSLFAGYGGLDLAVEEVFGGELAWYSEIDKGALKILEHRFPGIANVGSVTEADWSQVEPVDILTGGYPCQPFSHAGRREGAEDPRHLWPHVATALGILRPSLVVLENVRGHLTLGFDEVIRDLSLLHYDVSWTTLRAADVGAAHGRARIFMLGRNNGRQLRSGTHRWGGLRRDSRGWRINAGPTQGLHDRQGTAGLASDGSDVRREAPAGSGCDDNHPVHVYLAPERQAGSGAAGSPGSDVAGEVRGDADRPRVSVDGGLGRPAAQRPGSVERGDAPEGGRVSGVDPGSQSPRPGSGNPRSDSIRCATTRFLVRAGGRSIRPSGVQGAVSGQRDADLRAPLRPDLSLLPTPRSSDTNGAGGHGQGGADLRTAITLLPTPRATRGGSGTETMYAAGGERTDAERPQGTLVLRGDAQWGDYAAAIARWESVIGRPAPEPTQTSTKGNPQLSAAFVEWLMGLPAGWVTDVPGITRNEALKALGNGVVPQQATEALRIMLDRLQAAA